jgi:epoxyqueuosine reductase
MPIDSDRLILIAKSLGFSRVGVASLDRGADGDHPLSMAMAGYRDWLAKGYAGEMQYLHRHAELRADPARLLASAPEMLRAVVVTMDYLPESSVARWPSAHVEALADPSRAVISVYAHGRDYHKVLRGRLAKLADELQQDGPFQFRACVDSAPVLEVELARRAGLGWRGKHTLLLNREQGSMFFLGVLLTDMPLAPMAFQPLLEESDAGHCGRCRKCLDVCPTQAFVGPYELDARRCISYLTIEHAGSIPLELRSLMGNRIYGCDDCQQACPWNQYAKPAVLADFDVRDGLDRAQLIDMLAWDEATFGERFAGSAVLRIGFVRWQRNLVVAIGNSMARPDCPSDLRHALAQALDACRLHACELVRNTSTGRWPHRTPHRSRPHHHDQPSPTAFTAIAAA